VGNTPPVVTAVRIFPAFPRVGDRMRCEADGEDAEGSEVSFSFAWKINGVSTGVFGAQVDGLAFERDDVVTCVATPHDGSSAGTPDEADALVANTPPVATPSFDPAIPSGGEDLRCVAEGEDADGDSLNFRYAWTVNDVSQAVTGNTLPGARFQSGDTVACQVWANDGRQEGEPGSVQALVGNGAPSLARVVLNTYSPVPTQDLVATPEGYSDPDGDAAGDHRFAWYVQAYGTGPWRRVGDDSDTLSSVEYGKHDKVYVEVTPVDEHGAAGEPVDSETATVIVTWSKLAGADSHTCGIQPDGSLWCWGQNNIGQLGTGSTAQATSRVRIGAERAWADVAAGGPQAQGFTCAVDRTGGLWCWGYNGFGQLGTGNAQPQYVPTRVGSESDWAAVSAGQTHACALKTDRSAWCWGHNHVGQLGDASTANRSTPVRVGTGNTWTHVDAGTNFTCGLTADRTAWCWGYNNSGQLGIGSIVGSTTPRSVGSHSGWVQIFAGDSHACGRKSSGEVLCWGSGGNGRLGNGSVAAQTSPVSVQGVFAELSGGQIHNCARDEDDALWCWGHGANGRLGLGDQSQRTQPTQVGSEEDWTNIFTMGAHTCGLRGEGALWCWGYNTYGQLGLGTVGDRLAPNEVEPD
jgi:alpha-tubulin suppressor-like RCC1 family protein